MPAASHSVPIGDTGTMTDTRWIDLRSDTVTQPTAGMRAAMAAAPLGDDVYGDDPSVIELEQKLAALTGHEAGVFAPSGTQSNLLALLAHCQRGDEYLVGQEAHTYRLEGGGAAVLGSIQPQPIHQEPDGTLDLEKLGAQIKPIDDHYARTKLVALENTTYGKVLPLTYLKEARTFATEHRVALHLDGARVFNAAVACDVPVAEITALFDSVSICLSKGLGAPIGSVLCASEAIVTEARKWRKMLGGGMRQAGMLAAAGTYALDHHVERLADDHANAQRLAVALEGCPGIHSVTHATNMVFVRPDDTSAFADHMHASRVRVAGRYGAMRLVCHLDVSTDDVDRVIDIASRRRR